MAFCFNGSSSFPLSLVLFPALSVCRYSESFQPSMQSLYEEFHQLAVQKKQDYAEYRQIRKEKEELLIAKRTVETILNIDRQKEQEKEKEKEEKKNFR